MFCMKTIIEIVELITVVLLVLILGILIGVIIVKSNKVIVSDETKSYIISCYDEIR